MQMLVSMIVSYKSMLRVGDWMIEASNMLDSIPHSKWSWLIWIHWQRCWHMDGWEIEFLVCFLKDLIYTRVFSMIVVRDTAISATSAVAGVTPFECYAYVCDSRQNARILTIALATAFQEFSKSIRNQKLKPKRIAIDLRTPEEMALELEDLETEAWRCPRKENEPTVNVFLAIIPI